MKKFIFSLFGEILGRLTLLANAANEAAEQILVANASPFVVLQGNRIQLSPYGDFPHDAGKQRLTQKEAETIVANFNVERIAQGDKFGGLPFFVGHPDVPAFADRFKDTRAFGWIMGLEAASDGLYANVKWNSEGERLIKDAVFKFVSPTWYIQRGGDGLLRPVKLKSVGLTNTPNIPVAPLANEQSTQTQTMPPFILKLLGLPENATEEQVTKAITDLQAAQSTVAQNVIDLKAAKDALANEQTAHGASKEALKKEREARADLAIANAIAAGRITAADKDAWKGELVANEAKYAELDAKKPVIKTQSKTQGLKTLHSPSNLIANVQNEVKKLMKETGESYDTAWARVKKEKPELFANMKKPEALDA